VGFAFSFLLLPNTV
jgi:hypothetical protein